MTGPDRIWAWPWEVNPRMGQWSDAQEIVGDGNEYIRRDPAVLAALPEVQAMIAAAYEAAARACDAKHAEYILGKGHAPEKYDSHFSQLARKVRSLTTSDATAALAARDAAMIARGMREDLTFDGADWFWRVMDPDDNGDNPSEAITRGYIGQFTVCEIACSYRGPTRFGFNAPVLDHESDEDEFLHFETQQEAIDAAKDRRAAILALTPPADLAAKIGGE